MKQLDKPVKAFSMAVLIGLAGFGIASCEREGPVERAGEEVDEAMEETGDAVKEAAEETEEAIEEAKDKVEEEVK